MNSIKFILIVIISFQFSSDFFSQCQEVAMYENGKFRYIQYDSLWNRNLLPLEYSGFNGLTKEIIDQNNSQYPEGDGNRIKDSSGICGQVVDFFAIGAKWAIFDVKGFPVTDFKYDELIIYRPRILNFEGRYEKYGDWENVFIFMKLNKAFGLIIKSGREITPIHFSLPYIDKSYGDNCDTILFSTKSTINAMGTPDCGSCRETGNGSFNFPIAGSSIILVKDNKLGSIDSAGKTVIPFNYDSIKIYKDVVETFNSGQQSFYAESGTEISGFDEIHPVFLVDKPEGYSTGRSLFQGIYLVKKNGKWGWINSLKNEKINCILEEDYGQPVFESEDEVLKLTFLYQDKDISLEIKNGTIIMMDENENDVTSKFMRKIE